MAAAVVVPAVLVVAVARTAEATALLCMAGVVASVLQVVGTCLVVAGTAAATGVDVAVAAALTRTERAQRSQDHHLMTVLSLGTSSTGGLQLLTTRQ